LGDVVKNTGLLAKASRHPERSLTRTTGKKEEDQAPHWLGRRQRMKRAVITLRRYIVHGEATSEEAEDNDEGDEKEVGDIALVGAKPENGSGVPAIM
jgi:hypothetical protein